MDAKSVSKLFNVMGIPPDLKGYPFLIYLASLSASYDNPPNLKDLYAETGRHFGVSATVVSEDIRTVLKKYWNKENAKRFTKITRFPVEDNLTTKEFVSVVSEFIRNHLKY